MKSSARNQLAGTVSRITTGAVNDEVELLVDGGHRIVAVVTRESTERLGLAVGVATIALVKASSIVVMTDLGSALFSARNQMSGRVVAVQPGAVNAEVRIDVGDGLTIAAIVTRDSAQALGLSPGQPATVMFKASSVILGVLR